MNEQDQEILERWLRAGRSPGPRAALRPAVLAACAESLRPDWTQRGLRVALIAALLATAGSTLSEQMIAKRLAAMNAPKQYEKRMREQNKTVMAGTTLSWLDDTEENTTDAEENTR